MVTESKVIQIIDGPGELDFITALLRGGIVNISIPASDGNKKYRVRIAKAINFSLGGQEIEVAPGQWLRLGEANYSPKNRRGEIASLAEMEEGAVCGHLIPKGFRFCPRCGRDQTEVG
jgi:hypothetical protein